MPSVFEMIGFSLHTMLWCAAAPEFLSRCPGSTNDEYDYVAFARSVWDKITLKRPESCNERWGELLASCSMVWLEVVPGCLQRCFRMSDTWKWPTTSTFLLPAVSVVNDLPALLLPG